MDTVTSRDGTRIAIDRIGQGPALVLVLGAFNDRHTGANLAELLSDDFTVVSYDRRGRGDSGDSAAYAIDREIEDLQTVIEHAGGRAQVFGFSSGAVLALHAAIAGLAITKLALYEPPPTGDAACAAVNALAELIAHDNRAEAVEYFQQDVVGIPAEVVAQMRHAPFRPALEAIAHTLVYDMRITCRTPGVHDLTTPTLIISGQDSLGSDTLQKAAHELAERLPNAEHKTLNGLNHDLVADKLGPELRAFLDSA